MGNEQDLQDFMDSLSTLAGTISLGEVLCGMIVIFCTTLSIHIYRRWQRHRDQGSTRSFFGFLHKYYLSWREITDYYLSWGEGE